MSIIITTHAKKRAKERLGIGKNLTVKLAEKALTYGLTHSDTKGSLKRYCDKIYLSHRKANNIRIYNRKIFVFKDSILITIINLPNNLSNIADSIQNNMKG